MSSAYRTAFEAYCVSYSDLVAAEADKATSARYVEEVTVDGSGQEHVKLRPHPAWAESRNARKELRQAAQQLGITPATSARVVALGKHEPKAGIRAFQARKHAIDGTAAQATAR
jgi:phage terminase small subunit